MNQFIRNIRIWIGLRRNIYVNGIDVWCEVCDMHEYWAPREAASRFLDGCPTHCGKEIVFAHAAKR